MTIAEATMANRLIGPVAALLVATLMCGCDTMTPDECKLANWSDIGMRDGLAGKTMSTLNEHAKSCSKAGTAVDSASYIAGRERGLHTFCRLENAAPLGLNGSAYAGVCPAPLDFEFRRRHEAGYAVYALRSQVSGLDSRSERLQRRLRDADKDESKQLAASDKDDARKRIRKEFDERRRDIRNELRDIDRGMQSTRDALRSAEYVLDNLR
ncbi:DUF2799 domain-containing protein [Massilia sp. CCM 8734]|nr:DUF2799 domain-containing protein [Massilia sp. CCM 8734]